MCAVNRRNFLKTSLVSSAAVLSNLRCGRGGEDRPNILWITTEDLQPLLGCYGYQFLHTPNLDRLAAEGIRYERAFAPAPVCSPARSGIITGVHACSQGTQNLHSVMPKSPHIACFTEYLREAGYYCTNNVKEDYQFVTPKNAWDESSDTAHWRNNPGKGPFFSVFNLMTTHQSQTRYTGEELKKRSAELPPDLRYDPAHVPLPPLYADTPLIRENVAALFTQITIMDGQVGDLLQQLEDDGLADETIVFFYADNGTGLPRGKRWLHDTGLHVPFIIRFPDKYRHMAPAPAGSTETGFIDFIDLAPTLLSLTGLPIPGYMQGTAFLGAQASARPVEIFAARDRVDEVIEFNRSLREDRYHYIRNFYPHRPRMQVSWFSEITPVRREMRRLDREGKLQGDQTWLMQRSIPAEELYDTQSDPLELENLAGRPEHQERLAQMRERLYARMIELKDTGLLPEGEMHQRMQEMSPYDMARETDRFPVTQILDAAKLVGMGQAHQGQLERLLQDTDAAVRYWAAVGLAALAEGARSSVPHLRAVLKDASQEVRTAAAEAFCRMGDLKTGLPALADVLDSGEPYAMYEAAAALQCLGKQAAPVRARIERAKETARKIEYFNNRRNVLAALAETLGAIDGSYDVQQLFDEMMGMG